MPECEVRLAGAIENERETLCGVIALRGNWIMQLAVFAGWQRRGVGSSLLGFAKAQAPSGLQLHTFERNAPARRFYERHGFVAAAFGLSPAPECEPDVLYRWAPPCG